MHEFPHKSTHNVDKENDSNEDDDDDSSNYDGNVVHHVDDVLLFPIMRLLETLIFVLAFQGMLCCV